MVKLFLTLGWLLGTATALGETAIGGHVSDKSDVITIYRTKCSKKLKVLEAKYSKLKALQWGVLSYFKNTLEFIYLSFIAFPSFSFALVSMHENLHFPPYSIFLVMALFIPQVVRFLGLTGGFILFYFWNDLVLGVWEGAFTVFSMVGASLYVWYNLTDGKTFNATIWARAYKFVTNTENDGDIKTTPDKMWCFLFVVVPQGIRLLLIIVTRFLY